MKTMRIKILIVSGIALFALFVFTIFTASFITLIKNGSEDGEKEKCIAAVMAEYEKEPRVEVNTIGTTTAKVYNPTYRTGEKGYYVIAFISIEEQDDSVDIWYVGKTKDGIKAECVQRAYNSAVEKW